MIRPTPVPTFSSSRLLPVSPGEVFSLVGDGVRLRRLASEPDGSPARLEVEVEHVGGPQAGRGATYEVVERIAGRDMGRSTFSTDEYERDRLVAYRSDAGFDSIFELEPVQGGTLLSLRRDYDDEPGGVLRRAATRFGLSEETVVPEIDKELARIDYALRSPASEPTEEGGFRVSTALDHPPSAVFAYVADGRHLADWLDPSGERARVEHTGGPRAGVGARYRLTRRDGDEPPQDYEFAAVEHEPGRRVAYEFPGYALDVFEVSADPGGTRLSLERRPVERRRGLRGRLLARQAFTADRIVPEIERHLDAIRRALT